VPTKIEMYNQYIVSHKHHKLLYFHKGEHMDEKERKGERMYEFGSAGVEMG
jgi:hypothetical protein